MAKERLIDEGKKGYCFFCDNVDSVDVASIEQILVKLVLAVS